MDRPKEEDLTPIRLVSKEISVNGSISEYDCESAIKGLLWRLMEESSASLRTDPESDRSREISLQYQALAELVVCFGSTLAALNDMEEDELSGTSDKARDASPGLPFS